MIIFFLKSVRVYWRAPHTTLQDSVGVSKSANLFRLISQVLQHSPKSHDHVFFFWESVRVRVFLRALQRLDTAL